ncbi:glutamine--fructose-6-phosphate transaminase (isomerizing) [Corynebacterium jeikeium]|uniref:Glutamine--fructose-6-phosphate aminotransferase [isomerizing] n=1 Tax=Corynebacterium jeikeium (strain K411) TaxID=306537 RepID=Q4JTE5_CORJK|nr:glutamine--fructose-6-phosphate transaminase (isomerizing) [Corynebacterium jeikeium]EEW15957.1 glutamine-fructose-6-phosphate transaminase (isomerizing) [Corynebacterium jeikeium ATCC 43734]OOD31522.1 glutamine--fructose-6-phosphate aminotransferase [Corynebacterium jeikeium]WCZ54400.1 Glutamine--fructose-6-phosphate aminotransferase [isomerizing] [Corynebacterium jeikeium]CAI37912.1 glucosamine--fructose-6-phosphate aminotransferase [Corynebacterium jeikeium K411]SQI19517.1 glucosamine--f
MCAIVGYVGNSEALQIGLDALERMEYRGYDSAGIAVVEQGSLHLEKKEGKLQNLIDRIDEVGRDSFLGTACIGHTRWATHGRPNDVNAHPHRSFDGKAAIVHNGIIENFSTLRAEIEAAGIELESETDSEVAAHLLALAYNEGETAGDFQASALKVLSRLDGAFTVLFVHDDHPGTIVAGRRSTPLIVGVGEGEMFLGSDVAAFIDRTKNAVELGQDNAVVITADSYDIYDFDGNPVEGKPFTIDWDLDAAQKDGFDSFMMKEIHEQPAAVRDTLAGHFDGRRIVLDEQRLSDEDLRGVEKVFVVACGSAYHSGLLAKYAIEHWVRLPVEIEVASEFRYRDPVLDQRTLVVAVSQSGETADTLEAVRHAKMQGARVLAVCNTNGSQIPRESDAVLYTHAGPEIGVASTKAFLAQVAANYLVGLALAQARGTKYADEIAEIYYALEALPEKIEKTLGLRDQILQLAEELGPVKTMLFLGRHVGFPVALEGALKLKELAYIHAEGFAAGELKHGPIALIEDDLPVVVVVPSPNGRPVLHSKIVSNIQEIRARGAKTIVIAEEGDEAVRPYANWLLEIPGTTSLMQPLLSTVPLQFLAADIARQCGNEDIDKPRNLAKSVTVE